MKHQELIKTYFRFSEEERRNRFRSDALSAFLGKKIFAAGRAHIVILNDDGTVSAYGDNSRGQCGTADWSGVDDIFAEKELTVGITKDGAVFANSPAARAEYDPKHAQDDEEAPPKESDFGVFNTSSGYWIYHYRGSGIDIEIPETIDSQKVTGIGSAFRNNKDIRSIVINEGIREIDINAFSGCDSLERVSVPGTVDRIDKGTFRNCPKLSEVILAEGIGSIGPAAFKYCPSLKRLHIPDSVNKISIDAFDKDIQLTCDNNPYVEEYAWKHTI